MKDIRQPIMTMAELDRRREQAVARMIEAMDIATGFGYDPAEVFLEAVDRREWQQAG